MVATPQTTPRTIARLSRVVVRQRARIVHRVAEPADKGVGEQGQASRDDQGRLDDGSSPAADRPGEEQPDGEHRRGEDQVVQEGAPDGEPGQIRGPGVDVVVPQAPDPIGDDRPTDRGREPEPQPTVAGVVDRLGRPGLLGAVHATTSLVTHLVWVTPERPGPISRTG